MIVRPQGPLDRAQGQIGDARFLDLVSHQLVRTERKHVSTADTTTGAKVLDE